MNRVPLGENPLVHTYMPPKRKRNPEQYPKAYTNNYLTRYTLSWQPCPFFTLVCVLPLYCQLKRNKGGLSIVKCQITVCVYRVSPIECRARATKHWFRLAIRGVPDANSSPPKHTKMDNVRQKVLYLSSSGLLPPDSPQNRI